MGSPYTDGFALISNTFDVVRVSRNLERPALFLIGTSVEGTSPRIQVEELGLDQAVRELSSEWAQFRGRAGLAPFLHPSYLAAWMTAFGGEATCRFVIARRGGELAGVGPFMIAPDPFGPISVPTLRFIGNNVGSPGDVLFADVAAAPPRAPVVRAILEFVAGWRTPKWDLGYLSPESETKALAPAILGPPNTVSDGQHVPYVVLRLQKSWDEFLQARSGNARRNFRRRLARLGQLGHVEARLERDPDGVRRTVRELIENHRRWWGGTDRANWFGGREVERFLEDSSALLAAQGEFRAFRLEVGGHPIAWNVGAYDGTRYYEQFISFDRAYTPDSPGVLLAILSARHLIESETAQIELGPGINDRKRDLGGEALMYDRLRGYRGWYRAVAAIHASLQGRAAA